MHLCLVDTSEALVGAWRDAFRLFPGVSTQVGDIFRCSRYVGTSPDNVFKGDGLNAAPEASSIGGAECEER